MRRPQTTHPTPRVLLLAIPAVVGSWMVLVNGTASAPPTDATNPSHTVTYDVSDLVRTSTAWRSSSLGLNAPGGMDGIVQILVRSNPPYWAGTGVAGCRLTEVNGTKLEVYADAAHQAEVRNLLAALRRVSDVAVILGSELYEVDRDFYEKEIEPRLTGHAADRETRPASPLGEREARLLRKKGTRLRSHKVTILQGGEAPFFSLRRAFSYRAKARARPRPEDYAVGFTGVTLRARVAVSADRRRVRLTTTQDVAKLRGIQKQSAWDEQGNETTIDVPNLLTTSTIATVEVDDGELFLLPVPDPSVKDPKRVTLLLAQPLILIEEEERERKKQGH